MAAVAAPARRTAPTTGSSPRPRWRLGQRPALDGVRALAIAGVVGFHASTSVVPGGYLGVDVFFVLSGFLITALCVEEWVRTGGIGLRAFYLRRALRLLPALALMLAAATAYAAVRPHAPETATMGRDLVATTLYVGNWPLALLPHYETRLLSHTWSLGVEEQFYLLWPLVLIGLLALARRHGRRGWWAACGLVAAGVVASGLERWVMLAAGTPGPRISWGTDTRAGALCAGAALALVACGGGLPGGRIGRHLAQVVGGVGLGWIVWSFVGDRYGIPAIGADPGRNLIEGISATTVATVALIAGICAAPRGLVARVCSLGPVVWVGRLSYGIYLFHFPVFVALGSVDWPAPALLAARLGLTAALTLASWHVVERPFLQLKARLRP